MSFTLFDRFRASSVRLLVRAVACVVALIAISAPAALSAQAIGAIAGRVVRAFEQTPIRGVVISLDAAQRTTQTDGSGRFTFANVDAGSHTLEIRRIGFTPLQRDVTVSAGTTTTIDISLPSAPRLLGTVTVIGTTSDVAETRARIAEVPGSVAMIEPEEIRSTRQANLADVLRFTPGVYVQPRSGAADESQISVRGSGLRNNFHARGINLLVNGMPYRNADGFTDFESLELLTTESIQVYKGANALRYGGSTLGGAINFDTKTGYTASPVAAFAQAGSFGFYKTQVESGRALGAFDYYASYARTSLDGYREWSAQKRDRLNLHTGYQLSPRLDARTFYFYAHVQEQLPGARSEPDFDAAPEGAEPGNVTNRWGRDYDLHHVGVQLRAQLTPTQRLEVSPYTQYRDIDHPIFQVIAQISRDYGLELRYENSAPIFGRENRFTLGIQPAYENMDNRQYVNQQGERGALTKDQKDEVTSIAVYAENLFAVTPRVSAVVGARFDRSDRKTEDFFLANGDQSDSRVFRPVTPRAGILYALPGVAGQLYANASRTFEPPLLLELNSLAIPGFIDLDGQSAWQYELGTRGRRGGLAWDIALYDIELRDEILNINVQPFPGAPFTVPTYRNAPKTRHSGLEAGLSWRLPNAIFARGAIPDGLTTRLGYTYAQYTFVDDSSFDGNDIPGAPRHHLSAELKYTHPSGFSIAPMVEWVPASYYLNSENTVKNDAWSAAGLRAEWVIVRAGVTAFAEARNLFDRRYSASVQVDNAAGKYYEPADARSFYGGLRWTP